MSLARLRALAASLLAAEGLSNEMKVYYQTNPHLIPRELLPHYPIGRRGKSGVARTKRAARKRKGKS